MEIMKGLSETVVPELVAEPDPLVPLPAPVRVPALDPGPDEDPVEVPPDPPPLLEVELELEAPEPPPPLVEEVWPPNPPKLVPSTFKTM